MSDLKKMPNIVLVGNKKDLVREVTYQEGYELASTYGCKYFETSCMTGGEVQKCFAELVRFKQLIICYLRQWLTSFRLK